MLFGIHYILQFNEDKGNKHWYPLRTNYPARSSLAKETRHCYSNIRLTIEQSTGFVITLKHFYHRRNRMWRLGEGREGEGGTSKIFIFHNSNFGLPRLWVKSLKSRRPVKASKPIISRFTNKPAKTTIMLHFKPVSPMIYYVGFPHCCIAVQFCWCYDFLKLTPLFSIEENHQVRRISL